MSWWDDFTARVSDLLTGPSSFLASHEQLNSQIDRTPVVGALNQGATNVVGAAGAGLGWAADQASHAGAAALTEVNPDYRGDRSLSAVWNASHGVSPGQALLSLPTFSAVGNNPLKPWENDHTRFGAPTGTYGGIDPTDPAVRKQAFESGGIGEVGSWAADAVFQYYANPQVLAGQALKPTLAIARGTEGGTTALAKIAPAVASTAAKLETGAPLAGREVGVADLYMNRGSVNYLLTRMDNRVANRGMVAATLSGTRDFAEFSDAYLAALGDPRAMDRLYATSSAIHDALTTAQGNYRQVAQMSVPQFLADGTTTPEWTEWTDRLDDLARVKDDLMARSQWIRKAVGDNQADTSKLFGQLRNSSQISPLATVNRARSDRAQALTAGWSGETGYWTEQMVKPVSGSGRTIRFIAWAGGRAPRNIAVLNGPAAAALPLTVRDWLVSAKMDQATVGRWTAEVTKAANPAEAMLAIGRADHDVMTKVMHRYLPDNATDADRKAFSQWADKMLDAYNVKKGEAQAFYSQKGFYLDPDTGDIVKHELFDSQVAQSMPLTNYPAIDKILSQYGKDGVTALVQRHGRITVDGLAAFSGLWKAGVLLRFGAIPKNLGETWLASYLYLGRFAGDPVKGVANMAVGQWNRYAQKLATDHLFASNTMSTPEALDLLAGKVGVLEANVADKTNQMAEHVITARAAGHQAYYDAAPAHGTPLLPSEVTREGGFATTRKGALSAKGRAQFTAQARRVLRERRDATKAHVVVPRDGTFQRADVADLTPEELASGQVHTVAPYERAVAAGPQPSEVVDDLVHNDYPRLDQVWDAQARTDLADLAVSVKADRVDIEAARTAMKTLGDIAAPRERVRAGMTPIEYAGYSGRGGGMGVRGQLLEDQLGATSTASTTLSTYESTNTRVREYGRQMQALHGSHTQYDSDDIHYFKASAEFANHMVRNSELAKRLLGDEDPVTAAEWLLHTPEGQGALQLVNLSGATDEDVLDYAMKAKDVLHKAYPAQALRRDILDGDVTEAQVRAYLEHRDDLSPTVAREYAPVIPPETVRDLMKRNVDALYRGIWAIPEQRLGRYPLYNALYQREWRRVVDDNLDYLQGKSVAEANDWLARNAEPLANEWARHMVTKIVYTAESRSNIPQKMRFISPFLQVTANRLYYYGSQAVENPQNVARMLLGWNAISTTPNTFGEQVVTAHLPRPLAKVLGIEDTPTLLFTKDSLNLMTGGSTPWYAPGFGPPVVIPVVALIKRDPTSTFSQYLQKVGEVTGMLPAGYVPKTLWDTVLPTWGRRLVAQDGPQYARTQAQILSIETWRYQNGLRKTVPTLEEITARNDALWHFRLLAAVGLPAQPQLQNDMVAFYTAKHDEYVKKYTKDADTHFLADFPEYYDLIVSSTKNVTGVQPNLVAQRRATANGALIDSLADPSMAAMITNLPGMDGQFDQTAYDAQVNTPVTPGSDVLLRQSESPQESFDQRVTSRGWIEYRAAAKQRDALLAAAKAAGGSGDIGAQSNLWIALTYNKAKNAIIQDTLVARPDGSSYSPWFYDYQSQDNATYAKRADSLSQMLADPHLAHDTELSWLPSAATYLDKRDQMVKMLEAAKQSGGSGDISAQSNTWLALTWAKVRASLAASDPAWGEWQARYFANDDLTVSPGSAR